MTQLVFESTALVAFIGGSLGIFEMVIIGAVAVLLFGSRLPEVARSLGSSYQQFKKGLSEIQSSIQTDIDIEKTAKDYLTDYSDVDDYDEPTAPKFEPPVEEEVN